MSQLVKARIFDPQKKDNVLYVQFNPNTLDYAAGTSKKSARKVMTPEQPVQTQEPQPQGDPTGRSNASVLSVKLFYHTYTNELTYTDVRQDINRIRAFLPRKSENRDVYNPSIAFAWGKITHVGTLESFQVSYQMFAADGTPVQAEVSLRILGEDPDVIAQAKERAAKVDIQSDVKEGWRKKGGKLPGALEWLFQ